MTFCPPRPQAFGANGSKGNLHVLWITDGSDGLLGILLHSGNKGYTFPLVTPRSYVLTQISGLTLEDMDRLFMKSMHRAAWSQITRRGRPVAEPRASIDSAVDEKDLGLAHIELREKDE